MGTKGTVWVKLEDAKAAVDAVSFDISGEAEAGDSVQKILQTVSQQVLDAARADIKERLENIDDKIVTGFDLVNGEVIITDPDATVPET